MLIKLKEVFSISPILLWVSEYSEAHQINNISNLFLVLWVSGYYGYTKETSSFSSWSASNTASPITGKQWFNYLTQIFLQSPVGVSLNSLKIIAQLWEWPTPHISLRYHTKPWIFYQNWERIGSTPQFTMIYNRRPYILVVCNFGNVWGRGKNIPAMNKFL